MFRSPLTHKPGSRRSRTAWYGVSALTLLIFTLVLGACAPTAATGPSSAQAAPTTAPAAAPTAAPTATEMMAPTTAVTSSAAMTPTAVMTGTAATVQVVHNAKFGDILADGEGRTLYLYTVDTTNTSNCYGKCATAWPPLYTNGAPQAGTGADASLLGTTTRTDGKVQATYNGHPLYYWFKDTKAGDTNGQNVGGIWFVVSPAGEKVVNPVAGGTPAASATAAMTATAVMTPTAAMTATTGTTGAAAMLMVTHNAKLGDILADGAGRTLYLFTKDTKNTSNCYGACATAWPPFYTNGAPQAGTGVDASMLGTTTRTDGKVQVTYNGAPLYYFAKDTKLGDATGQDVGKVWFAVSPSGTQVTTGASSSGATTGTASAASSATAVSLKNFAFNPKTLTVSAGTTVTWTNNDTVAHTVTADDGSFDSKNLDPGATFSYTFAKAGTYPYYCAYHGGKGGQGMSGVITVK
jgi:predicted lipoprotein with Yx(FWY)xxD motif/plastocyanin